VVVGGTATLGLPSASGDEPDPPLARPGIERAEPLPRTDRGDEAYRARVVVRGGVAGGGTSFRLSFDGMGVTGRSQLDWPVSGALLGVDLWLGGDVGRGGSRRWDLRLTVAGTVSNPFGPVIDQDWLEGNSRSLEISDTSSTVTGHTLVADASIRYGSQLRGGASRFAIQLLAGARYEFLENTAWGYDGWYIDNNLAMVQQSMPASVKAGVLTAQRVLPYLGVALALRVGRVAVDLDTALLVGWTQERDDHVIRGKLGTADCGVVGASVRLAPRVLLGDGRGDFRYALGLDAEARALLGLGTLHQHYYVDDPQTTENELTVQIPDTMFTTQGILAQLSLTFQIAF
jgi:hypothetical protein